MILLRQRRGASGGIFNPQTNHFYQHMEFSEFEVIPAIWGESNPCQIYVGALSLAQVNF